MNNKWFCPKCSSWNENEKSRCSFCSNPKPIIAVIPKAIIEEQNNNDLTQQLHNAIEKMSPQQKRKLFRWLEDNVL